MKKKKHKIEFFEKKQASNFMIIFLNSLCKKIPCLPC